jgi:rubredoxin
MSIESKAVKNPLAGYFRQPKIYVKLPSQGQFYPPGSLDVSETGDYPVYPMTAKDELMFKTPDALMNGQATVEIIKSCMPAIINPWVMPSIDLDAVLIAIRIATYGDEMEINATCPSCVNKDKFNMDLVAYLNGLHGFEYASRIDIDPLTIHVRPYTYKEVTKMAIRAIEQEKIFDIVNDESMSDEEKLDRFGDSFVKLTDLTVDIVSGCISKIDMPEGSVEDQAMISEFIQNAPKEVFEKINQHIVVIKDKLELKVQGLKCSNCEHVYSSNITVDQSNFFEVRS